jgi:electron transfer flavoprotein-quinone oxidoreductase
MSDDRFDCIVVGAGIAGCVAAYLMAQAGLSTVLIERGDTPGSKNMTGGRLYAHSLEKVMPGFAARAPIERKITRERICMLTDDSSVGLDFQSTRLGRPGTESYAVLRRPFDHWLAEQAEAAGADIISGICVEDLLIRDGVVCGVVAGDEELEAKVTILADGCNSLLAQKAGLRKEFSPDQLAVSIKELIGLPASVIEDRFQARSDEGTATMFVGTFTGGSIGGGFLYTNKESVSLGIVSTLGDLIKHGRSTPEMMDAFKNHPAVAPLIAGGTLLEYSGHILPEGGISLVPQIIADGVLVVGDSGGFCVNLGYVARGMDFAVSSAEAAAHTVIAAVGRDDFSEKGLAGYRTRLEESYVLKDMQLFRNFPHFMESTPRLYEEYPRLAADVMEHLFTVDGTPSIPLKQALKPLAKKVGLTTLLRDGWNGMKAL